jgi:polyisoprenoid-binding protein YceI
MNMRTLNGQAEDSMMRLQRCTVPVFLVFLSVTAAVAQPRAIDGAHSTLTVHAYKSGLFSGFAHDHEVSAPILSGTIEDSAGKGSVRLKIDARQLKVLDPKLEEDKRTEVQKTMHSERVLDSARFPNIEFVSSKIQPGGPDKWTVTGDLTLHGQTHSVTVAVTRQNGHYLGSTSFKQQQFGITPVSIGGGTIKVKDEVKIEFDVVTK